jgi:hypothetical protein
VNAIQNVLSALEIAILTLQTAWPQRDHRSTHAGNGFEDSFRCVDLQIAADDQSALFSKSQGGFTARAACDLVKYGSASAHFSFKSHFAKDGTCAEKA